MPIASKRTEPARPQLKVPIHYVQRITGLPSSTLRNWEKRYQVFYDQTARATFRRSYTIEDLCRLDCYARLTTHGVTPSDLFREIHSVRVSNLLIERVSTPEARLLLARLNSALASRDTDAFNACLAEPMTLKHDEFCEFVAEPIFRRIGEYWHEGRLSIAEEHITSATLRRHISNLTPEAQASAPTLSLAMDSTSGPVPEPHTDAADPSQAVLLCSLETDAHEGALLILRAALGQQGVRSTFVGSMLPVNELSQLIATRPHSAIIVSLTHTTETVLSQLTEALDQAACPVFIGGLGAALYSKRASQPHVNLLPATSATVFGRVLGKCFRSGALS